MEIYHQYVKLRKEFGRHPKLVDEGAEMLADIRPNEQHAAEYIPRNPVTTTCQVVPEMSEHEANTNAVIYVNKAMTHIEGGWPKEVDYTEAEHVIRYCKKVEKDEEYIKSVVGLSQKVERLAKQNNAIDIYEEYFHDVTASHAAEVPYANTVTVFRDPQQIKRNASQLSWSPDGGKKLAVAYSILEFQRQPMGMSLSSYIWDVNNPNTPDFELTPLSQLCCVKFNNKDPNIVGAGQYNGQFSFFDFRKGSSVCESSPIEKSHQDPLFDFSWLQSKTGTECMSVSTDGYVLWWDIRKLAEPVEDLPLKDKNSEFLLGGVALEYDPAAGATKFMIGTEQGTILSCNRKAKNPQDRVGAAYQGHHGPVYALKRNPFYPKYFVSIGDWAARLWSEDLKTPLIQTKYHPTYLMSGGWSPSRPGVFFTIKKDGCMDVWDMYYTHNDPVLKVQVTDQSLVSFGIGDTGQFCAVGSVDGNCAMLELCKGLVAMAPNEKSAINNMFERETSREKNLEKIQKEAKIKAKKEAAKKDEVLDTVTEEELQELEENFYKAINAARSS